jgi:hypothetical protein
MKQYLPQGNNGSIATNGVCNMCHNEAQPYWREAKTLPPITGNDFSGDGNAVARWRLDNGALTTDSIGTNTLSNPNSVVADTVNYQEGDASGDFESSNNQYLEITDLALASNFPLKSGGSGTFSTTVWYKPESLANYRNIVAKMDFAGGKTTWQIRDNNGKLEVYVGRVEGPGYQLLVGQAGIFSVGTWYHIGFTFNNSDRTWKIRVYDDSEAGDPLGEGTGVVVNTSGTAAYTMTVLDAPFTIGAAYNNE